MKTFLPCTQIQAPVRRSGVHSMCPCWGSVSGIQHSLDLPVCFSSVQPLPTHENGGHPVGSVGDLHTLQVPACFGASVVMLHPHPQELPQVQHLQHEAVGVASLKQVAELLLQGAFARVPVDPVDGDEDVGVGASAFHVTGDNDDLVLHRHQAPHLTGEALHGLGAFKGLEVILFGREGDLCITVKCVPVWQTY